MDDHPFGGIESDRGRVRNRVADRDELEPKRPVLAPVQLLDRMELCVDAHFLDPTASQLEAQARAVDRNVDVAEEIREGADVVLVAVGDHHAPDPFFLIFQIFDVIRDDQVDAQHIMVGEHNARVDDQDVAAVFDSRHIFSNFPQSSEGDDL